MDQASRGKKALAASDYEKAILEFTAALKVSPTSPDYLIQRSTAYHRAKKFSEALDDANEALRNAENRAKRELIVEAQFRKGCAYYNLNKFEDAQSAFSTVKRMDENHKMVPTWIAKTEMAIKRSAEGGDKGSHTDQQTPQKDDDPDKTTSSDAALGRANAAPAPMTWPQTPADKIRYEWYQNTEYIYFSLLAKGVPKEKAEVDIQERSIGISFPYADGSSYDLTLDPLFAALQPDKCITNITPAKIELILAKATANQKWTAIEGENSTSPPTGSATARVGNQAAPTKSAPAYPTSSKSGPKDWDKVTKEAQATLRDPNAKSSAEEDDDFEGGDEANHFFKKLYKNASPEVQRAMMKSYMESNGTSLSTNWDEVSKGPVETVPPDGMEAKKWDT